MSLPTLDDFVGMSADTGAQISGDDHLYQSLRDIIGTPKGTRVLRRTYGSDVPALQDAPMNPGVVADIVASVAEAIIAWEPRVLLQKVIVNALNPGGMTVDLLVQLNGKTVLIQGVA